MVTARPVRCGAEGTRFFSGKVDHSVALVLIFARSFAILCAIKRQSLRASADKAGRSRIRGVGK